MTLYLKGLRKNGRSNHSFTDREGNTNWDLPQNGRPGAWKRAREDELVPHHKGLHLAPLDKAVFWFLNENYLAEAGNNIVEGEDCVVTGQARLITHLPVSYEEWAELALGWAADVAGLPGAFNFAAGIGDVPPAVLEEFREKLAAGPGPDLGLGRHTDIDTAVMALKQYAAHSNEYYYNCEAALAACEAVRALKGLEDEFSAAATAQHVSYLAAKAVDMAALAEISRSKPPRPFLEKWIENAPPENPYGLINIRARNEIRRKQNTELLVVLGL